MNNALLYLGGLIAAIFAALFAVPTLIDWNGYRGVFEEEASKALGREVRAGGAVNLRLLPTPYVRFEKVRLADTTGQTGEPFIRAESFTLRLAVSPLLRGVFEANEVELKKPVLNLVLDENGGGSWSELHLQPNAVSFLPRDLTLNSVRIIDGTLAFYGSDARPLRRVEAINGEFAAESLSGPFKFKGAAQFAGERRDIKFATTALDADGGLHVKGSSHASGSPNTFTLDGRIEQAFTKPKLTGELSGKIPIPGVSPAAPENKAAQPQLLDFKSQIEANTSSAKFDDIVVSLDDAVEPQLITGSAVSGWGKNPRFDVTLQSKWLDADRLAGAASGTASLEQLQAFGLGLLETISSAGAANASFEAEQVKIGGENAGAVRFNAARAGDDLTIRELRAGLPGNANLHLSGVFKGGSGQAAFSGDGFVYGSNLTRLLAWAEKSGVPLDVKANGAFSAGGRITASASGFELSKATAEVSGKLLSGEVKVTNEGRRSVAIVVEGSKIDLAEVFPGTSKAVEDTIRRALNLDASTEAGAVPEEPRDVSLRLLAGEVQYGAQTYKDVDAVFGLDRSGVRVPSAKFVMPGGLAVTVEGASKLPASGAPTARFAYELSAASPGAMQEAVSLLGGGGALVDRFAAAGSGKVAGLVKLGERGKSSVDVSASGVIGANRVSADAAFEDGLRNWRVAPSRWTVRADFPSIAAIGKLTGGLADAATPGSGKPVEAVLVSAGNLETGATALTRITSEGFSGTFNGTVKWPVASNALAAVGAAYVKANSAPDVLALFGIDSPGGMQGTPVDGLVQVSGSQAEWIFASQRLDIGGEAIAGSVTAKIGGPDLTGLTALSGDVTATRVALVSLFGALSGGHSRGAALQPGTTSVEQTNSAATPDLRGVWPEATLALEKLPAFKGQVGLKFARLEAAEQMVARDGSMTLAFEPGKFAAKDIKATALGGRLDGAFSLIKNASGVDLGGKVHVAGADLAKTGTLARGTADLVLEGKGLGVSVAGAIGTLNGNGQLVLDAAEFPGPSPATGTAMLDRLLKSEDAINLTSSTDALKSTVAQSRMLWGARSIAISLVNGVVKLDPVLIASTDGKVETVVSTDLSALTLKSTSLVSANLPPLAATEPVEGWSPPADKGPLPPVRIVYNGRLDALNQIAAAADATEFQRELALRITERNVAELERIRRLDEQRARQEAERRKALEAERAAAAAQAKALRNGGLATPVPAAGPPEVPQPPQQPPLTPSGSPAPVTAAAPPTEPANLDGQAPSVTTSVPPPASDAAAPASLSPVAPSASQGTPIQQQITIEPDPALANPASVRKAPVPRPATPRRPTTAAEDLAKSFGGFP